MRVSRTAVVAGAEKGTIKRSYGRLRLLLKRHFGSDVVEHVPFGSFSRQTILPRRLDEKSDVDFMVVFDNDGCQPQTYLDRLRRFVEANYNRSEIKQSHPTIQLSLNHITFELVPAIKDFWGGYQIPVREDPWDSWMSTNPTGFNNDLVEANKDHNQLVKPLVRVLKYWNAVAGYPFESFVLEREIVEHIQGTMYMFGRPKGIKGYLYDFTENHIDSILPYFAADWRIQAVDRLCNTVEDMKVSERQLHMQQAVGSLQRVMPPTWITV